MKNSIDIQKEEIQLIADHLCHVKYQVEYLLRKLDNKLNLKNTKKIVKSGKE